MISIHALLAESDRACQPNARCVDYFYPRSPCGERRWQTRTLPHCWHFYPRSPCGERRQGLLKGVMYYVYFYPRSPCGERLLPTWELYQMLRISIHALLAESDRRVLKCDNRAIISIHALLAESDTLNSTTLPVLFDFYPRSPCGERLHGCYSLRHSAQFLSTLSLRRATLATW